MRKSASVFTKKKALTIVLTIGVLFLIAILLRLLLPQEQKCDVTTLDGREVFFKELGWEIDRESEEYRSVVVPDVLEGIMLQYNKMQLAQGYDLSKHPGERCRQYTYVLKNYPDCDSKVMICIYVRGNEVIAGDIHTAAANGFMHGLKKESQQY